MSIDDRLRASLRRNAAAIAPDVERQLARVTRRSRRRTGPLSGFAVAATSIVAIALVLRLGGVDPVAILAPVQGDTTSPSSSGPGPSTGAAAPIAGTYRVTLEATDPTIAALGMAGDWTITLRPDAAFEVVAPETFAVAAGDTPGADVYAVSEDLLYTNLFSRELTQQCAGSGTYRWQRIGGDLTFQLHDDACPARIALFTSGRWTLRTE